MPPCVRGACMNMAWKFNWIFFITTHKRAIPALRTAEPMALTAVWTVWRSWVNSPVAFCVFVHIPFNFVEPNCFDASWKFRNFVYDNYCDWNKLFCEYSLYASFVPVWWILSVSYSWNRRLLLFATCLLLLEWILEGLNLNELELNF